MTSQTVTQLLKTLVPDTRVQLCDVQLDEPNQALIGVADEHLKPNIEAFTSTHQLNNAVQFPAVTTAHVCVPRVFLQRDANAISEHTSEAHYNQLVRVYDKKNGFVRVATSNDNYLGWVPEQSLTQQPPAPTHTITNLRAHAYAAPRVQSQQTFELSFGMNVTVINEHNGWSELRLPENSSGFVKSSALMALRDRVFEPSRASIEAFARLFLDTPYVWGGGSAWGLDCSGLAQRVFAAHGIVLPRDADQQEGCGQEINQSEARAGDLFFFPGHVAIALSDKVFIHANAQYMRVTIDAFDADDYGRSLQASLRRTVRVLTD